jgi:hypothetical protein
MDNVQNCGNLILAFFFIFLFDGLLERSRVRLGPIFRQHKQITNQQLPKLHPV